MALDVEYKTKEDDEYIFRVVEMVNKMSVCEFKHTLSISDFCQTKIAKKVTEDVIDAHKELVTIVFDYFPDIYAYIDTRRTFPDKEFEENILNLLQDCKKGEICIILTNSNIPYSQLKKISLL